MFVMMSPSDQPKSSANHQCCTLTGLYSSAYKLSAYALQWLLPDTALDSIIDVSGYTFDASLSDDSYFTLRGAPVDVLHRKNNTADL